MKSSRRVPAVLAMVVAVVLGSAGGFASRAQAQSSVDRLRPDVVTAEELTDEHRQRIDVYVDHWTEQLQTAADQQVPEARNRLLEPLRASPSEAFQRYYSPRVGEQAEQALENERMIVRMNMMIVVARLSGATARPLIEQGMTDENPAVRYWAVKAVQTATFTDREKQTLMGRLVDHLDREPEVSVAEQTMLALVDLALPEATTRSLEVLNERVDRHLASPGHSLQAEYAGLQRVYRQLAGASNPERRAVQQLARAAVRYQDLAAQQLQAGEVEADVENTYVEMIALCDAVLQRASDILDASGTPDSSRLYVNQQNWESVQENAEQWRVLMQRPPFSLSEQELALGG